MPFTPIDELLPTVQPQLMDGFPRNVPGSNHPVPLQGRERCL
jgi:hypothetical protein